MTKYEQKFKENFQDICAKKVPPKEAEKTQEALRDTTVKLEESDLRDAVVEIRFLALSWLDDFEKELFGGKTIDELLNHSEYD